jgi:hypothetical protein
MTDQYVNVQAGELLILEIGNGAVPEMFTPTCTINTTRKITFSNKSSTAEAADCTNPSSPAQTVRQVMSTDLSFDGDGLADGPSIFALVQWNQGVGGTVKNCKIVMNRSGANGGFTLSVPPIMDSCEVGGARGEQQTFTGKWSQQSAPTSMVLNP